MAGNGNGHGGDDSSDGGSETEFDGFEVHWPVSAPLDGPDLENADGGAAFDAEEQQAVWKMMQNNGMNRYNMYNTEGGHASHLDHDHAGDRDSGLLMMNPSSRAATPIPPPLGKPPPRAVHSTGEASTSFESSFENSFVEFKYNQGQGSWWSGSRGGGGGGSNAETDHRDGGDAEAGKSASPVSLHVKYEQGSAWYTKHASIGASATAGVAAKLATVHSSSSSNGTGTGPQQLTRLGGEIGSDNGDGNGNGDDANDRANGRNHRRAGNETVLVREQPRLQTNKLRDQVLVSVRAPPQLAPTPTSTTPSTSPTSFLGFDLDDLGSRPLPALSRGQEQAVSTFISDQLLTF